MRNYKTYIVKQGDTLQGIAQKMLGDASKGMEIALINNLSYPFLCFSNEDIPNTKCIGDTLYIPITVRDDEIVDDTPVATWETDSDILLVSDDSSLTSSWGGDFLPNVQGDVTTVSELKSLAQDIRHRLMTEQGTLLYHPEYGSTLYTIVGSKKDTTWTQKAMIEVHRCILCDDRVESVDSLVVEDISGGIHIKCSIITKQMEKVVFEDNLLI